MCYAVPAAGAAITSIVWSRTKSIKVWWLNLMFIGGALFGIIDHLWNGELFMVSGDIAKDLLLGVTISAFILLFWFGTLVYCKHNPVLAGHAKN